MHVNLQSFKSNACKICDVLNVMHVNLKCFKCNVCKICNLLM